MNLSYADAFASPWKRAVVRQLEKWCGAAELQRRYDRREEYFRQGYDVFATAMQILDLQLDLQGVPLDSISQSGPMVFVANHPFGVIDGIVASHVAYQIRTDFQIMVIAVIRQMEEMRDWVLPIDFTATEESLRTNLRSRAAALRRLREGKSVLMFPAGRVATTPYVFGQAAENPWHPFLGKLVLSTQATVVPLYIPGQNSWKFHLGDRLGTPVRMAMMMRESAALIGATIQVVVGKPLGPETWQQFDDRAQLVDYLQGRTCQSPPSTRRPV